MSHFSVAVIIPKGHEKDRSAVEDLMAPYQEGDEWLEDGTRWDWYVIGGRWDGEILGLKWLDLKERCIICNGTGTRDWGPDTDPAWIEKTNGCNGCQGTGKSDVWPTDDGYETQDRNITTMGKVSPNYTPYAFVSPTGEWIEQSRVGFWGADIPDEDGNTKTEKLAGFDQQWAEARTKYADHVVVGLDCHV